MRTITILTAITLAQFMPGNVAYAESYEDCRTSCAADDATRLADCPSPYDSANDGKEREQCIKASHDSYVSCIENCPPPPPSPEPETSSPPAMGY